MGSLANVTDIESWLPQGIEKNDGWRVDAATIVLLAIIGDPRPDEFTRAITASSLVMLPRLVPAMQLLNAARPAQLPQTRAVASEISGPSLQDVDRRETVGYFVNALHQLDKMPRRGFRVLKVSHNHQNRLSRDVEVVKNFKMARVSPSHLVRGVLLLGFGLGLGLITAAALWKDGPALISIALMGIASSLIGHASSWRTGHAYNETGPASVNTATPVTIVIKTSGNGITVVRCDEAIYDELYLGTLDCCFYRTQGARCGALVATGSVALMVSVATLASSTWKSQLSVAVCYIFLNAVYWAVSLLPRHAFWDMSRYRVNDITPADATNADQSAPTSANSFEGRATTARTLWYAIREVGSTAWVEEGFYVPPTDKWKQWLAEAQQAVDEGNRAWQAVRRECEIMQYGL
jgi:hypothetical protein